MGNKMKCGARYKNMRGMSRLDGVGSILGTKIE
jgi:hypothetical protein